MSKVYSMRFGSGDPRAYAGMSPTFLIFVNIASGATIAPPAITESCGTSSGIYQFTWGTTTPIAFLVDAATTSPGAAGRYVTGQIDPVDRVDEVGTTLVAIGTSHIAQGVTLTAIGTTLFGFGVTNVALGTSAVAQGVSILAQGVTITAIGTSHISQGITLTAIGTSTIAFGSTLVGIGTTLTGFGVSTVAFGSTLMGYGSTLYGYGVSIYTLEQAMATSLMALGTSVSAIGTSLSSVFLGIGSTASSYGTSSADPVDLFGYLKRIQENLEGNSTFTKLTGAWSIYTRGSSALLISKTVANSSSQVIKT